MMKSVLISIDDYIFKYNENYYLDNVGIHVIRRYSLFFDSVKVIARCKNCCSVSDLGQNTIILDMDNVKICEIPFFQGMAIMRCYHHINKIIDEVMSEYKYCIARIPSHLGFILLWKARKKMIRGAEVVANPYQQFLSSRSPVDLLFHIIQKYFCKTIDGISFVTKYSLQKTYLFNIKGQYVDYISDVELDEDYFTLGRDKMPNSLDNIKLCHVCAIIGGVSKGHFETIDVVRSLKMRGFNVEMVFVGKCLDIDPIVEYSKKRGVYDNISFVGFLDKLSLRELFIGADAMIFPSHSEGLPRVLLEACAVGLPCVTSNVGGMPEIITKECRFNYSDIRGMSDCLYYLLTDNSFYSEVSNANVIRARNYEKNKLQVKLNNFFEQLLLRAQF